MDTADIFALAYLVSVTFFSGFLFGQNKERMRAARYVKLGEYICSRAMKVKETRKLIGDGMTISQTSQWTIGGVGEFDIVIKETAGEQHLLRH